MTAYNDVIAADSPYMYYKLDEASGTIINSGSGTDTVTKGSGITQNVAGIVGGGKAISSTGGVNGYLSSTLSGTPWSDKIWSIEWWMKGTANSADVNQYYGPSSGFGAITNATGKLVFNIYGGTTSAALTSTTTVTDGAWHHIVVTSNGNDFRLYVDGSSQSTSTTNIGTFAPSTTLYMLSNLSSTGAFSLDEFAFFDSTLSSTRVTAHYKYGSGASFILDQPAVTATALAVDPAFVGTPTNIDLTVGVVTATAQASDPNVIRKDYLASTIGRVEDSGVFYGDSNTSGLLPLTSTAQGYLKFSTPTGATNTGFKSGSLTLWSSTAQTVDIHRITADFAANTTTAPSVDSAKVTVALAANTTTVVDVASIFDAVTFYGFRIDYVSGTAGSIGENSSGTSGRRPVFALEYEVVPETVDYTATAVTMSGLASDVTVETTMNVDLTQTAVTASLAASDVTVETVASPDVVVDVETPTASLTALDATVGINISVDVVATGPVSLQAYDAEVENTLSAIIDLDTPRMTTTHKQLTDVNGQPIGETEEEDKYFTSTMALQPRIWYRLNATSGTTENARVSQGVENTDPGRYYAATIGLNGGPNGRKYVHFNGTSRFEQFETQPGYLGGESYGPVGTLEFSLRTTKENQFIMRMDDATRMPATDRSRAKDISLKDGKFRFNVWAFNPLTQKNENAYEFNGYSNLADGEWHHIIVVNTPGDVDNPYYGISLFVDGVLEFHRRYNFGLSFPDYIGGRGSLPGLNDPMYAAIPLDYWYVGDMTEVVSYETALSQDEVYRQNDTLFGYDPVYVEPARTNVYVLDATVKTNAKRVLNINLGARQGYLKEGNQQVAFQGLVKGGATIDNGVQVGPYQFFSVDAYFSPVDAPGPLGKVWWEEKYDVNRMLDLVKDLNLADFDILNVSGYPTTGQDFDDLDAKFSQWALFGGPSARKQLENLMVQIRTFAVNGGGLYITDPSTAKAVGVIDDFDFVDLLQEKRESGFDYGNSGGDNDLRAAKLNPWGNSPNGPSTTIWAPRTPPYQLSNNVDYNRLAHFYRDEHGNQWQTVRNLVDGLTDIPGFILTDALEFWSYLDQGGMWAEKWEDRPTGLTVGDTFRIMGTRGAGRENVYGGMSPGLTSRVYGLMGAPVSAIKAGIPVTTFAPTYWDKDQLTTNPFKDWATSIVVRPGDTLAGQTVSGRIYVNFTESFADLAAELQTTAVDQIPANADINNPAYYETDESREWTYSTWRGSWGQNDTGSAGTSTQTVVDSAGNVTLTTVQKDTVVGINYTHRWPVKREPAPFLNYRGLAWVGSKQDDTGNATVGVAAATMTTQAREAVAETQASAVVDVAPARMTLESYSDRDTTDTDAVVLVQAPSMTLRVLGFQEVIDVEPARMTLTAHDDLDGILASADLVVLRLPTASAVLTLEEK